MKSPKMVNVCKDKTFLFRLIKSHRAPRDMVQRVRVVDRMWWQACAYPYCTCAFFQSIIKLQKEGYISICTTRICWADGLLFPEKKSPRAHTWQNSFAGAFLFEAKAGACSHVAPPSITFVVQYFLFSFLLWASLKEFAQGIFISPFFSLSSIYKRKLLVLQKELYGTRERKRELMKISLCLIGSHLIEIKSDATFVQMIATCWIDPKIRWLVVYSINHH